MVVSKGGEMEEKLHGIKSVCIYAYTYRYKPSFRLENYRLCSVLKEYMWCARKIKRIDIYYKDSYLEVVGIRESLQALLDIIHSILYPCVVGNASIYSVWVLNSLRSGRYCLRDNMDKVFQSRQVLPVGGWRVDLHSIHNVRVSRQSDFWRAGGIFSWYHYIRNRKTTCARRVLFYSVICVCVYV